MDEIRRAVIHDERGQKFVVVVNGEDCIMAYTEINDFMEIQQFIITEEKSKEILLKAAFEFAGSHGKKISIDNEDVMKFIEVNPQYRNLAGHSIY